MISSRPLGLTVAIATILWLTSFCFCIIRPELDPRTRMISEYARGPHGWIMQFVFFCVALSCGALAAAVWVLLPSLGPTLLIIYSVSFAGAGVFVTDPVSLAQKSTDRSGALHVLFAFVVIVIFPIMATVVDIGVAGRVSSIPARYWLSALSTLPWSGFLIFIGEVLISGRRPVTSLGYFESFLVFAYSLWPVAIALTLAST